MADFTDLSSLDVDSRGRIYVGDFYRHRVTVLSPEGRTVRTFGRRGGGPGEFQAIRTVQVLAGDSVLVYDPSLARASVFAPDSDAPAYVVNLGAHGPAPFFLWRIPGEGGFLALFRPSFYFSGGKTDSKRTDRVRVLAGDGSPRTDLLSFPSRSFLVAGNSVTPNPFGREGIVRTTPRGEVLYLWTDSVAVTAYSPTGQQLRAFSVRHAAPKVTAADVEKEREQLGDFARAAFEGVLRDSVPERWPPVKEMVVDQTGQIWLTLVQGGDTPVEWAAFAPDGRYLHSVFLPRNEKMRAARLPLLYVEQTGENNVPRVVVYRVTTA